MGMAASQSRFLSLTARKSNVEYEGQQINQERTALANESSNLYAELTKLDVPAPPNTSDFYKTVYTFSTKDISGATTQYTLDEIFSAPDGDYALISHEESYFAAESSFIVNRNAGGMITSGMPKVYDDETAYKATIEGAEESGMSISIGGVQYGVYLDDTATLDKYLQDDDSNTQVMKYNHNGEDKYAFYVIDNKKHYISGDMLSVGSEVFTSVAIKQASKNVQEEYPVTDYGKNDLGRTTDITIAVKQSDGSVNNYKYELNCTSVEDEDAYAQAMRDYEYYQQKYEKKVSDINAKTELIQQEDKSLELELKQLDTEQNAIKTEMDAVQKVIEDNVEATFKTFG